MVVLLLGMFFYWIHSIFSWTTLNVLYQTSFSVGCVVQLNMLNNLLVEYLENTNT